MSAINSSRRRIGAAAVAVATLLAGCGYEATPVPEPAAEPSHSPVEAPDCTTEDRDLASFPPSATGGPAVQRIRTDEVLRVGVSADTYLMASRDPRTNRIVGFDIEIVQAIGEAIFGAAFEPGRHIQYRVITAADRIPLLQDGELDLVVRNMTINSCRWADIAFSQVYYNATQKVLVRSDQADGNETNGEYHSPDDLAGQRVCAPTGSTSLDRITEDQDEAVIVPATNHTGCLVRFQQGEVDAITGDDTVLAGLAAQDPYAAVPEQEPLSDEPYGVGASQGDEDLVAFINQVLEDMRADGSWQRAYDRWLRPELQVDAAQPIAVQPYRS
ncbi:MAG TPA: glutamate ABC transporter substrate-binding protein [Nocardioides sp.]|nr:glutamate ABC transporter substrate-binding protein [Nocardioides sp.]